MDKKNHKLKLEADDQYMSDQAAATESFGEKSRMKAAGQNGEYYKNVYENMKKGGEIGMHPAVAQTMGFIKKKKVSKMQSGGNLKVTRDEKITEISKGHNKVNPGGQMRKNPNWVFKGIDEESGVGTAYRFEDGYKLSDTDSLSRQDQYNKLAENNFRDAYTDDRREFLEKYMNNEPDDRFSINSKGEVVLKDKNVYLGNVNTIQELDYRRSPSSKEGMYQIRSPRYIKKNRQGGKLEVLPEVSRTMAHIQREKDKKKNIYRSGGSLNIIPKGVTHEEDNNIGDKGIPIVSGDVKKKVAEIEVNELTLNKKTAEKVEALIEEFKKTEDPMVLKELGKYVQLELRENTVDNQGELL
jgi:hypothetical protein